MNSCQQNTRFSTVKKQVPDCFSVSHNVQLSLSVIPARKRLELVGIIWWVMVSASSLQDKHKAVFYILSRS